MSEQKPLIDAVAGNPNAGKSTLINAIAGSRLHVGNWPGVAVEEKEALFEFGGRCSGAECSGCGNHKN